MRSCSGDYMGTRNCNTMAAIAYKHVPTHLSPSTFASWSMTARNNLRSNAFSKNAGVGP